jgi:hypothetical protein
MGDRDLRTALRGHLRRALPTALLVDELGILRGHVRADVVAVADLMHGFEIKAACDSRARLPGQVAGYSRVFDGANIVTERPHLRAVLAMLPPWWGVLVADGDGLREERPAGPNPAVETRAVAELLWAEDVLALLEARRAARGYRGKPCRVLWARLCEVYTDEEIRAAVRGAVRRRRRSAPEAPA